MPNRYGYTLSDLADMPPEVYPRTTDEEKIRRLMAGRPMLPVEYRQEMSPAEQQALYSQKGMQPQLLPTSLLDLAVNNPVSEYIGEAIGAGAEQLSKLGFSTLEQLALGGLLVGTVTNKAGQRVPGTLKPGNPPKYLPAPASIEREAGRTLGELVEHPVTYQMHRAMQDAEKKLRWQEYDRSRMETKYGPLRPADFDAPKRRLHQNTQQAVDERVERVRDFLRQPTEPWRPREFAFERAPIRDALAGFPDVEQTSFTRTVAPRAVPS